MTTHTRDFSNYFLWALLALPSVALLYRYMDGSSFYGEIIHLSGQWATQLLIFSLAVSPLRLLFPKAPWNAWLLRSRRYFGVASFAYAALHTGVYVVKKATFDRILSEGLEAGLLTGWLALIVFLPLAITSNNYSVRLLRRNWKFLHRLVYLATALVFAHWLLTAFDRSLSIYHIATLLALEFIRLALYRRTSSPG